MMDKRLESGASNIVPVYLDKEGKLSNSRSSTVTKYQFEYLQKYMNKIIKQIAKEILTGNIELKPYYSVKIRKHLVNIVYINLYVILIKVDVKMIIDI